MLKNILFNLVMLAMLFKIDNLPALLSTSFSDHVEAIIFDCDGVLVDTEYFKFLSWQKALASLNIEFSIEEYKAVAGHTSKRIVEILQKTKGISIPDEAILLKRIEYQKLQELGIPMIEEMVHFVRRLSQNKDILGIKLGLASSAPKNEILFNLKRTDLEHVFDLVISGVDDLEDYVDPEGKNKPKPYIYSETAKQLNVLPKHCLVIEDTQAGIEAAVNAGMVAIAAPSWITKDQDFSKATKIINSISELHIQQVNTQGGVLFKKDEDLERDPNTTAESCLESFFQKGGCLKVVPNLLKLQVDKTQIYPGDAIYPICSGGWCRSQALWAILYPFSDQIVLFPPHAARVGWDPYNGKINRYRNYAQELVFDEFSTFFGIKKALRFGFENDADWKAIEKLPTSTGLNKISQFYEQHYFGPNSTWGDRQGKRRVYVAFSNNAHVTLHRLNQSNQNLQDVTVIAIESEDLITYPPSSLNTTSRSPKAYEFFTDLLLGVFDLSELHRAISDPKTINTEQYIVEGEYKEISDLIKRINSDAQYVHRNQQRYILTGGPGAGKTSIINFLAEKGYSVVPEAATEIIEGDLKKGIENPWVADDYHIRMYQLISKRQAEVQNSIAPIVFFDRGHLDGLSYILLQKRTLYQCILDHVQTSIDSHYFNKKVFFIDSLGFVVPGPARTEDLQESLLKANCLKKNYEAMGYEVIHIPPGSIEERAQLVIDHITKETK